MTETNWPQFQTEMRRLADKLCAAAGFAVTGSGFSTGFAAQQMLDECEKHAATAHAHLMAAKAILTGAPAQAKAVEIRDGSEVSGHNSSFEDEKLSEGVPEPYHGE